MIASRLWYSPCRETIMPRSFRKSKRRGQQAAPLSSFLITPPPLPAIGRPIGEEMKLAVAAKANPAPRDSRAHRKRQVSTHVHRSGSIKQHAPWLRRDWINVRQPAMRTATGVAALPACRNHSVALYSHRERRLRGGIHTRPHGPVFVETSMPAGSGAELDIFDISPIISSLRPQDLRLPDSLPNALSRAFSRSLSSCASHRGNDRPSRA